MVLQNPGFHPDPRAVVLPYMLLHLFADTSASGFPSLSWGHFTSYHIILFVKQQHHQFICSFGPKQGSQDCRCWYCGCLHSPVGVRTRAGCGPAGPWGGPGVPHTVGALCWEMWQAACKGTLVPSESLSPSVCPCLLPQSGGQDQERRKTKRRGDLYSIQTSLIVAALKKMLPIGLNMCTPGDQELISLAKARYGAVSPRSYGSGGVLQPQGQPGEAQPPLLISRAAWRACAPCTYV